MKAFIDKSQPRKLGILMPRGMGDSATAHFLSFL